jgi:Uncharacterized conserved protein
MNWKKIGREAAGVLSILLSALIYSVAIKVFVNAGDLFPAGFSGIAQLLVRVFGTYAHVDVPFSAIYLLLNIAPTILVFRHVGKRFTVLSVLQYVAVCVFVEVLPAVPVTHDIFLIAVFGGIVAGAGVSIALVSDASTGGTDFLAIYAASRYNVSTWNYIMIANTVILALAGLLFGWERAMYSIVYQFCSTTVISKIHMRYQLRTLLVVTGKPDEVCDAVFHIVRHGITKLRCEGGYSHMEKSCLYMTCNAFQVSMITHKIEQIDAGAFINVMKTEKVLGNYYQQPLE